LHRLLAFVLLCSALTGCELIADFDRSKIPEEESPAPDAGFELEDAAVPPPEDEDAGQAPVDEEDGG
jgi:hypothetical protein